jgi:monooxygenase
VNVGETVAYRGSMLSGVPNFSFAVGYTNASWTLKADLTSEYVCRVLAHMDAHGYTSARPPADPPGIAREPLIDLKSGYVLRSLAALPDQGSARPWKLRQNYPLDRYEFTRKPVDDGVLRFSRGEPRAPAEPRAAAASV